MKLKTTTLYKIYKLFELKNWRIDEREDISSLFYRYCERLKIYDEDEQEFIIDLTKNYIRIDLKIYLESFYESLILLGDEVFDKYDNIYIYPLLDPNSKYSKTKSGGFLHYMVDSDEYRWLSDKLILDHNLSKLKTFDKEKSLLIFIDDYVGSGDTAIENLNSFWEIENFKYSVPSNNIKIVCIAAQEMGVKNVSEKISVEVISNKILKRGITDFYVDHDIKKTQMRLMSQKLKVSDDLQLGYKDCEGLITMLHKTPNNTFPIYWIETRSRVAPFPRKKYFKNERRSQNIFIKNT